MMDVPSPSWRHTRTLWLVLLTVVAVILRVIRACQETIANPDTMRYIDQARGLAADPIVTLRNEVYHPLHAAMTLLAYQVTQHVIANDRMAWLWALRVVGIVAATVVTLEIVWLARLLGAPFWASVCASVAWLVARRTSIYGSDGLSDMLAIAFFGGSMLAGFHALRWLPKAGCNPPDKSRVDWRWFAAGIFAGLSYLTRPEGLAAVVILGACLLFLCGGRRMESGWFRSWKIFPRRKLAPAGAAKAAALMFAGALLIALPYMLITRRLTGKVEIPAAVLVAQAQSLPIEVFPHIARELFETFFWPCTVVFWTAVLWRPRPWGRPRLRVPVLLWVAIWTAIMAAVLLWPGKRYLDGRHTLPLQLVLFAMLGLAISAWEVPMRWWMDFWRRRESWNRLPRVLKSDKWPRAFAIGAVGVMLVPGMIELTIPPRADKANLVQAAIWIQNNTSPDVVVCDHERLVGFYSMHPYSQWFGTPEKPELHQLDDIRKQYSTAASPVPLLAGQMYELGSGDSPPASIGPYRAIAAFRSGAADDPAHDHLYVLYALPEDHVLKVGGTTMPATTLSALGLKE